MWRIRASFAKVRVVAPRGVRAGLDGRIVVHQGQDSLRPGDDFHVEVAGLGDGLGIVHTLVSFDLTKSDIAATIRCIEHVGVSIKKDVVDFHAEVTH